jgi:threonyl-tRNA synthetase
MDLEHRIGPEDLPVIEKEMAKVARRTSRSFAGVMGKAEAIQFFKSQGQVYKLQLTSKAGASTEAAGEGGRGIR